MAELTEETVNNLNKTLEKTNAMLLTAGNQTSQMKDDIESTTKTVETSGKKTTKMLDGLYNTLDKMVQSTDSIVSMVSGGAFIASLGQIAKNSWTLNNNMTALAVQMGKGREHAKVLEGSVSGMMKDIGSNYQDALHLVTTLSEAKYSDNIKEAAEGIDLFARATGVSNTAVAQLSISLNKQGDLSTKASNAILAGMVKVQQKVGISKAGMEALTQQISDMTYNMAAFGKSSEEISRAAVKTTALVGAMEKVGISAQRSVELINQLTDPDRIEDNILLYSQLGLSLEDALNGGAEEALNNGAFKEMADKIMNMGPIAGSQFAKSMGLSYKEVSRMAKMETGDMEELIDESVTPEEKSLQALEELTENTEALGKKIEKFFNKIQGWLLGLGPIILTALTVVAPKILALFKNLIGRITGKEEGGLQASVETSLENVAKKSIVSKFFDSAYAFNTSGKENLKGRTQQRLANVREAQTNNQRSLDQANSRLAQLDRFSGKRELTISEKAEQKALTRYVQKLNERNQDLEHLSKTYEGQLKLSAKEQIAQKNVTKAQEILADHQKKSTEIQKRIDALKEKAQGAVGKELGEYEKAIAEAEKKQEDLTGEVARAQSELKKASDHLKEVQEDEKRGSGSFLGNLAGGIKSRVQDKFGALKDKITDGGTTTFWKGVGNKAKSAGKSALGGIGKALGGIAKSIGPLAIGSALVGSVLDKLKEPMTTLIDNLVKKLQPVIDAVLPVICTFLNSLVKSLLPPVLKVLSGLLTVLRYILKPLEWILDALSHIPGLGCLKDISQTLKDVTGPEVTGALTNAADSIANSNEDLTKATEENTEATTEGPMELVASGGQAVLESNGSAVAGSSVGSVTQSTTTEMSDAERNRQAQKDSAEKERNKDTAEQTMTVKDIKSIAEKALEKLEKMVEALNKPAVAGQNDTVSWAS